MAFYCTSCGESYHTEESVARVLRNYLCCLNLTCLASLLEVPAETAERVRTAHAESEEERPRQPATR